VIIGNPPYVRIQNMVKYSPGEAAYYQSDLSPYITARTDNFDKYVLFIERALILLKPQGRLGYIVPHKFFTIKAGTALRRLISVGRHLVDVVHFGVQQVFGTKRTTYTAILVLTKSGADRFTVEHVADLDAWRYGKRQAASIYEAGYITDTRWIFVSPEVMALFDRLRAQSSVQLNDITDIFVGVQTSADPIYIIASTSETDNVVTFADTNGVSWTVEKGILRPFLHDVSLRPFDRPSANKHIIFPYNTTGRKPTLYLPEEIITRYPMCWEYLNSHKDRLMKRSIQGGTADTWYRYGRSQSLAKFNGEPKLIWSVLMRAGDAAYAYDDQNIVISGGGNGPYYALRPLANTRLSIYYIQAILSHPVIDVMVTTGASPFQGGYWSHGKQFIANLPIRAINFDNRDEKRIHEEIVNLVKQLIEITQQTAKATIPARRIVLERQSVILRERINSVIERLYGITADDLRVINTVLGTDE
jgi:hypothetical protein